MLSIIRFVAFFLLFPFVLGEMSVDPESFQIETHDGVVVHGDLYRSEKGKSAPLILLFHQGGSNARGEYRGHIVPELLAKGFNIMTIDQRRGGERLGGSNRTMSGLGDTEYGYCDAYPDLEAALAYASELKLSGKRIVWGSSYSAALVVRLAAEHATEIDGVIAFSPASGEPMNGCQIDEHLESLSQPLLVLRPGSEMEIESVQRQFELVKESGHQAYVAENGVHGSSMLVPDRVEGSVSAHWDVVMTFIEENTYRPVPGPAFEDVISLRGAGSPRISPDGKHIAFTVRSVDWEKNGYDTEIWLSRDGGTPFQLTRTKEGSSTTPRWSHNGEWLAFIADRGNKRQVYALNLQGGEARALTHAPEGVQGFAWSPDDSQLAYTMTEAQDSVSKAREGRYGAYAVEDSDYRMSHLWLVDVVTDPIPGPNEVYCQHDKATCPKSNEPRRLTEGDTMTISGFDWRPDGTAISIEHREDPSIVAFMTTDISLVEVESGKITPLVRREGFDGGVTWSPDGEWLLYNTDAGNTSSNFYRNSGYMVMPGTGGEAKEVFADFDENLGSFQWTPEGLFALAWQKTERGLFKVDVNEDRVERITDVPRNVWSIDFSDDGKHLAMSAQTPTTLSEIYRLSLGSMDAMPVTTMTSQIEDWELGTSEVVSWNSEDGAEIEGVLFKPADFDPNKKYPLLVVIHGGPTGIDYPTPIDGYVYPIPQWLAKGAVVLEPNYRGSAGYGEAFRSLNVRNLGVGDAWDVLSGVDHLVDQGFIDESRMGAMGWSQGGYISAFLTTNTNRFSAISVGAGISNWVTYYVNTDIHPFTRQYLEATPWEDMDIYLKTSPMTNINKASTPTLIQHGEFDRRVPIPNAYELFQGLQDQDVETSLIVYKGFGHGINKPKEQLAATWHNWQWFSRHVWGEEVELPGLEEE